MALLARGVDQPSCEGEAQSPFRTLVGDGPSQIRDRQYGRQHLGTGRTVTAVGLAFRRDLQTGPCLQVAQADLAQLLADRDAESDGAYRHLGQG